MKKILIPIIGILALGLTFAYTPTQTDQTILNSLYPRIDKIILSNKSKAENIKNNLEKIKENYKQKEKNYYILSQFYDYLNNSLNSQNTGENLVYKATFIEAIDGDTVSVELSGKIETIRMIGIDAPEPYKANKGYVDCGGKETLDHIKSLLASGDNVEIELDPTQGEKDKYSRILAYVIYSGTNINEQLIADGYGWEYTFNKDYKYKNDFVKAQNLAKQNKLGIYNANLCNGERKSMTGNVYISTGNAYNWTGDTYTGTQISR